MKLEKFLATVLREAYKRQVEEVMDTLEERPECLYKRPEPQRPLLSLCGSGDVLDSLESLKPLARA